MNISLPCTRADTSPLRGERGEKWSPQGRLPDWSFAGYHCGETPIPTPPIKASVRDFGAFGDGHSDDTSAFKRAIAATQNGALLIPQGATNCPTSSFIRKSGLILRGEGPQKSALLFTKPLEEIEPQPQAKPRA